MGGLLGDREPIGLDIQLKHYIQLKTGISEYYYMLIYVLLF